MNVPKPQRVVWIGPCDGPEFGPCRDAITRDATLVESDADLTVYACPRPLADTSRLAGLIEQSGASVVQLLGVWCEGEGRTGRTVEGAERVFWHAWPEWWRRWLAGPSRDGVKPPGLIRIDTPDRELAASLIDTLDARGVPAVWGRLSTSPPSVVVWDGVQLGGVEANRLAIVCQRARRQGSRVVVLLDFPRPETVAAARAIGADAVLGKPLEEETLCTAVIDEATRETEPVASGLMIWPTKISTRVEPHVMQRAANVA